MVELPLSWPFPVTCVPVCESVRVMVSPDDDPIHVPFTVGFGAVLLPQPAMASAIKTVRRDRRMEVPWLWWWESRAVSIGSATAACWRETTNGGPRHEARRNAVGLAPRRSRYGPAAGRLPVRP